MKALKLVQTLAASTTIDITHCVCHMYPAPASCEIHQAAEALVTAYSKEIKFRMKIAEKHKKHSL